ncbi:hypothetical protein A1359_21585 [Methylomonas lenta]|uniref:Macrodomain effector MavL domain-containing protein n=2 Tax=Methylomonas lenta TaxID=980561 RepID=A0A177NQ86_9GAMM|nr:hypothetical protein A1359_21585 [Methylomonas lenta]
MHGQAYQEVGNYLQALQSNSIQPGKYLLDKLRAIDVGQISVDSFLECLLNTKRPQIFAESAVNGNGEDWNALELKLLGAIGITVEVDVYDDGKHHNPVPHAKPFLAYLLFSAGALLRNGQQQIPVDWDIVGEDGVIDRERYYELYRCRLLPLMLHANEIAGGAGKQAFITIPGLGCGQFAGKFMGWLGEMLEQALKRLLSEHHRELGNIRAVYFDPYQECVNQRYEIGHLSFMVRPLTQGNQNRPQLCPPVTYQEEGDDFSQCILFSVVAWDHVSWPGNDFYIGARATDDGVKAAATSSMAALTGFTGCYNKICETYDPPLPYRNWDEVVRKNSLQLELEDRVKIMPSVVQ